MSNDIFDVKILAEKLSKLNNSQQCIESLSRWCVSYRKKARQIVETWEKSFNSAEKDQCVSLLFLSNDILQNSRRKGSEFVNEFWKVLPAALKCVYKQGDEHGKKTVTRLVNIWEDRKVFGSRAQNLKEDLFGKEDLLGKEDLIGKEPPSQPVSNGKSLNPVKIVKKDAQAIRIKLPVGDVLEKIVMGFHNLHDQCSTEEATLAKCHVAVLSLERLERDFESATTQGIQPGTAMVNQLQDHESILLQCVKQLEGAEATRVALVSQLKEALQDQGKKLEILQSQLQLFLVMLTFDLCQSEFFPVRFSLGRGDIGTMRSKWDYKDHMSQVGFLEYKRREETKYALEESRRESVILWFYTV